MKIGTLTKINKRTGKHNNYRHLIFYKLRDNRTMKIKLAIPLFLV